MRYFIDGGGHTGESVRLFRAKYPEAETYRCISFEPNPAFAGSFPEDVELHPAAIWTADGALPFYSHPKDCGFSLHAGMRDVRAGEAQDVPCVNFGRWLRERFTKDDQIVLKLDIEGSEYEVLEAMIADGSIALVERLFIEWHIQYRKEITEERHARLLAAVRQYVPVRGWDARGADARIDL